MFDHEFDLNQVELGEDLPGRASMVGRHRAGDHRLEGDRHQSPRGSQRSDRGPEFGELAAQRLDRRPPASGRSALAIDTRWPARAHNTHTGDNQLKRDRGGPAMEPCRVGRGQLRAPVGEPIVRTEAKQWRTRVRMERPGAR